MTSLLGVVVLLVTASGASSAPEAAFFRCQTLEGDAIFARDLARVVPEFSAVPPDTRIGYAPLPGARRFYHLPELRRLALRYNITFAPAGDLCFQRAMEALDPQRVIDAMRHALGNPDARIEIVDRSRYPVPRGEVQFLRSSLPSISAGKEDAPLLWRGFVRYAGDHRFAIWVRARILVRSARIVATENLAAGRPIEARQVRREEYDAPPSNQAPPPPLDQIVGQVPRRPISAAGVITTRLVEPPKDVERGQIVQVDVQSGGARLELEARAQADGRKGDMIPVRNMTTGKLFSARVQDKGRVVLKTALPFSVKDQTR